MYREGRGKRSGEGRVGRRGEEGEQRKICRLFCKSMTRSSVFTHTGFLPAFLGFSIYSLLSQRLSRYKHLDLKVVFLSYPIM
jgi:ribosomal protein L15